MRASHLSRTGKATAISSRSNVKNLSYEESDEVLASGLENPAIGPLASDWPGLAPARLTELVVTKIISTSVSFSK